MFKLKSRKFLITGASGGEGGSKVLGRSNPGDFWHKKSARKGLQYGKKLNSPLFDLSNAEEVNQLVNRASELMEGFDGLVCNAGITRDSLLLRMTDEAWQKVIDINLSSTFKLSREACKRLIKNNWGRIINISSITGLTGNAGQANYAASKAGIIAMSKSIAKEVASRNITVNCIAPGFIDTKMTEVLNEGQKGKILDNIPMKRMGTGEEIAAGVLFLASDEAKYITGHVLNINGYAADPDIDDTTKVICNIIGYVWGIGGPLMTVVIIGAALLAIFGRMPWPALFALGMFCGVFFGAKTIITKIMPNFEAKKGSNFFNFKPFSAAPPERGPRTGRVFKSKPWVPAANQHRIRSRGRQKNGWGDKQRVPFSGVAE
ncbi:nodulation protein G [Trichonephila inaurata madagascariensis]|uniref:3-oxoacyl-[acyl-carrier-protein] reductase n=1 Tax=Trichonephila inaurata madagascariensis TaxID=2747483 RepID=A0A8X6Y5F2_9ARAC|nr:nodulation protein G [Trichonephila inaurata madagascariensis]